MNFRRFAMVLSTVALPPAFGATLIVDNDFADCPQAEFNSIQAAVEAAQPGDKILVCAGLYLESGSAQAAVLVEKTDLRIEAQAAPGTVVLEAAPGQEIGFHLRNAKGVVLQGFTVRRFVNANIRIEGNGGNEVRKNIATQLVGPAASSIHLMNSAANVIEENTAFDNICATCSGVGVAGGGSVNNVVRHNETYLNGAAGIQANSSGAGNVFSGNRSYNNTIGIRNVLGSHGNVFENNYVFSNAATGPTPPLVSGGIIVGASASVIVRNNRSERNDDFGIRLQNNATSNLIEKNEVRENGRDGIRLESAAPGVGGAPGPVIANIIRLNLVQRNGRDGIRVFDSLAAGNTIERNVIRESGEHDARDDSLGPGTGGTANDWVENKCETENRPGLCKNP